MGETSEQYLGLNNSIKIVKNCIISESEVLEQQKILQLKCNQLQDELDSYNATHKIEFDTPLK